VLGVKTNFKVSQLIRQTSLSFGLVLVLLFGALPSPSVAQNQFWIQVESQNNIRDTKNRAQFFARDFPDTRAFATSSGWYAIVIGPLTRNAADGELTNLIAGNQIPNDSFVSDGSSFRNQLWPLVANTDTTSGAVVVSEAVADDTTETTSGTIVVSEAVTDAATETVIVEVEAGPTKDPDLKATKKLERSWTRDEKKQYQTFMAWTGDYLSAIDGSYGPGTRKAIKSFQDREGFENTGFLTGDQVALLENRYNTIVDSLGLGQLRDLDAGVELLYPANLVEFERFEPPFVHYKTKSNSEVRMMLISQEGGRAVLASLYEIMETFDFIPPDGYRVKKRDWFVLSGRNDDVVSYTYVKTDRKTVKGFTIVWPPKRDTEMQPLATAMYNSFNPLKEYVLDETLGYGDTDDQPVDLTTGLETPSPDSSASGFFINPEGVILSHIANISTCSRVTINEGTVALSVVAKDDNLGLAILKPTAEYTPKSYALFSDEAPELAANITVAGFSFPEVMEIATLNYGTLTDTDGRMGEVSEIRISAFLEDGDTGGPVLDDRGAVIGMQLLRAGENTGQPAYVNFALKAVQITQLLDSLGLVYANSTSFDALHDVDLAFMAGDFTVKISCWK
jgi:peptidoglycan hydrolase-like protein with peptidoglycan-binding domain